MDRIERLAQYLSTDVADFAAVELGQTVTGTPPGHIDVLPFDARAIRLRIATGAGQIPVIEFGTVASHECVGNARTAAGAAVSPTDELTLLIAAALTGGARLYRSGLARKCLVLGNADPGRLARLAPLREWEPVTPPQRTGLAFFQPPEYRALKAASFHMQTLRSA